MAVNRGIDLRTGAAFIRNEFFNATVYRTVFWLRLVYTFLMMYSVGYVWRALYATGTGRMDWTLPQMITYAVMGVALESIMLPYYGPQSYIMEQVRKGTIEMDIMKPLDFQFYMFAKNIGSLLVRLGLLVVPSLIVAYFMFGLQLPCTGILLAFTLSLILAILVSFLLNYMLGLLSMVTMNIRNIFWGYNAMLRFFSGQSVPLWLFPGSLEIISTMLPFRCIYSIPMSIYIDSYQGAALWGQLGRQALWCAILFICSRLMTKRVLTKLMIQGG